MSNAENRSPSFEEMERMLDELDGDISGPKPEEMVAAAEAKLGVPFPPSFRQYLLKWGNVSFEGIEYYGLTQNSDFDNSGIPNCVWYTLKQRRQVGLPDHLIIFLNHDGDEFICIDTDHVLDGDERGIAFWNNAERTVSDQLAITFAEYLHDELSECLDDA